jgi:hypothetical protein
MEEAVEMAVAGEETTVEVTMAVAGMAAVKEAKAKAEAVGTSSVGMECGL